MSEKIAGYGDVHNIYEKKFVVTQEWCLAINNIDYIRNSLRPFVKDLGTDEIIAKLVDVRSAMGAKRCEETLENVIENALDTEKDRILRLIDTVAEKMSPVLRKFLAEGAEISHQDSNSMDRVMMYLEDSLKTLNSELNEGNFERMLDAIWREIEIIMEDIVQTNLNVSIF
jgi:BAI1-associated protein 3